MPATWAVQTRRETRVFWIQGVVWSSISPRVASASRSDRRASFPWRAPRTTGVGRAAEGAADWVRTGAALGGRGQGPFSQRTRRAPAVGPGSGTAPPRWPGPEPDITGRVD